MFKNIFSLFVVSMICMPGFVSAGEWADARTVEMIYPALTTSPNTGTIATGTTVPDNTADFSLYWYLKWDVNNLYMLGVIYDDLINPLDKPALCFNPFNKQPAAFPGDIFLWELAANGNITPFYTDGPTASQLSGSVHGDHYVLDITFNKDIK